MRRRRSEIAAGAAADTPDVISQILLAGAEGRARRGGGGRAGPPGAVRVHRRARRAAHQLRRGAGQVSPPCRATCAHNPAMVKNFVEETLRYDGPAKNLCRQTTAELTIAGVTIPADSRVMVLMGSANRDERVYHDPDTFDLFRTFTADNKILTFGEGIHSCMGAPLARLTAQVAVEELVAALDGTEVRIVGTPERWAKQMVRGFAKLPSSSSPAEQDRARARHRAGADSPRRVGAAPQHPAHPGHPRVRDRRPGRGQGRRRRGRRRADPARRSTGTRCRAGSPAPTST